MANKSGFGFPDKFKKNIQIVGWFKKQSFKIKLILSFALASILPILILQAFSYYNTTQSMKEKINDLIGDNLAQASKNLDTTLKSYTDALYQIYIDDEIIEMINKMNNGTADDKVLAFSVIHTKLKNFASAKSGVRSIAIFASSGDIAFYDSVTASSIENIWSKYGDVTKTDIYKKTVLSSQMVLTPTSFVERNRGKDYYLFHISKKMHDFKNLSKEGIGIAVISINEDILLKACNQLDSSKQTVKNDKSINFIIDKDGDVVSFQDTSYVGKNINDYGDGVNTGIEDKITGLLKSSNIFNGKPVSINTFYDELTGWTIVNAADRNYLLSDIYWLQRITIIIGLIAMAFSLLFVFYISGSFSKSMEKILKAMKTAQAGELSVQVEMDENDEFSLIAARFNKMISRINLLVEEVKQATYMQKEAEIRALEAQINPHFLYNTLDSINWMAIEKEEHGISRMLKSLAQILRYSVNKSNKIVTIREEMEWLKQYIYLQQNRFNYSFECFTDIEERVLDWKIYKLMLQPFIENAIVHGFEGYTAGGIIKIVIKEVADEFLEIIVEDNGKGMDGEQLAAIRMDRIEDMKSEGSGIGLKNVFDRIRMYYGDKALWQVTGGAGEGTRIFLKVPKLA